MRRESFKFWFLVRLILEILRYVFFYYVRHILCILCGGSPWHKASEFRIFIFDICCHKKHYWYQPKNVLSYQSILQNKYTTAIHGDGYKLRIWMNNYIHSFIWGVNQFGRNTFIYVEDDKTFLPVHEWCTDNRCCDAREYIVAVLIALIASPNKVQYSSRVCRNTSFKEPFA